MRETMRKTTKTESPADDGASVSGASVSTNSWVDAQSVQPNEAISRPTSKRSSSPGTSQRAKEPSEYTPKDPGQALFLNNSLPDNSQSPSTKATRRRKTVTKTPHTFELAEDLKPTRPPSHSQPSTQEQISGVLDPPTSPLHRRPSLSEFSSGFSCSTITTTLNLEPIKARSGPPHSPHSPWSAPNPFTINHRHRKSSSLQGPPNLPTSNPTRFSPRSPTSDSLFGKVIVLVQGASPIGASIVRSLHACGASVIFGESNVDAARRLVKSLSEPHLVHFNKCDARQYEDLVDLFKLAVTMYGRVDHAIFGVGEDGAGTGGLGAGEKGWFEHATKASIDAVSHEPPGLVNTLGAAVRFAHIALAYLRHTPRGKSKHDSVVANRHPDRTLTFLTSVASFKEMPGLPIYQVTQHGVMGLMRSLRSSIDPEKDGVRVNAVVTGMLVPRAFGGVGGRMSVKLPGDMPEDIGRTVAGVITAGSAEGGNGIWYERESERKVVERALHGRAIYVVGGECWDIEDGLNMSEPIWLGVKPSETLTKAQEGIREQSQWIFL